MDIRYLISILVVLRFFETKTAKLTEMWAFLIIKMYSELSFECTILSMSETYKYLHTQMSTFGSLPTHKVFTSSIGRKTKLVFADDTFVYGILSDWALNHSGLDSRKPTWAEESKIFLDSERIRLDAYRTLHSTFKTEVGIG